ncbi:jmjC domain-containing protein 8-like isoform X1 [Argonauta hians]
MSRVVVSFYFLSCLLLFTSTCSPDDEDNDGGWYTDPASIIAKPGPCNIDIVNGSLTQHHFLTYFAHKKPFQIQHHTDNTQFRKACSKDNLIRKYGDRIVKLSTANTYSYKKVNMPLKKYFTEYMNPQDLNTPGNETLYWFGEHTNEWNPFFEKYNPPPYKIPDMIEAYSFGVAAAGTGVPFHFHGPGYAEMVYGRKRWFLFPPDKIPDFHPNQTTLQWLIQHYPSLNKEDMPFECTIDAGQAIYFPDRWWHATLNIDNGVFISTFHAHK